jgi:peptide/nickel transport system substrate-binding protein
MPEDIQELFVYDPELAIQMLDDAGYPDGFTVDFTTQTDANSLDVAALLEDQWSEIGVTLNIIALDSTRFGEQWYFGGAPATPKYRGVSLAGGAGGTAGFIPMTNYDTTYRTGSGGNFAVWSNPEFDALLLEANLEFDYDKQALMIQELGLMILSEVPEWCLYSTSARTYWWPWVENYYGEFTITDDGGFGPLITYMWIDEDMKEDMGY